MQKINSSCGKVSYGLLVLATTAGCGGDSEANGIGGTQSSATQASSSASSAGATGGDTASGGQANTTGASDTSGGIIIDFPLGDPCAQDSECPLIGDSGYGTWCKTNWPGGACTSNCNGPDDCGPDNSCGIGGWCVKKCKTDADCREEYHCDEARWDMGCTPNGL